MVPYTAQLSVAVAPFHPEIIGKPGQATAATRAPPDTLLALYLLYVQIAPSCCSLRCTARAFGLLDLGWA